jgi:hypothetical protein
MGGVFDRFSGDKAACLFVGGKQRSDLFEQFNIIATSPFEKTPALARLMPERCLEQFFHLLPSFRLHGGSIATDRSTRPSPHQAVARPFMGHSRSKL